MTICLSVMNNWRLKWLKTSIFSMLKIRSREALNLQKPAFLKEPVRLPVNLNAVEITLRVSLTGQICETQ